MTHERVALLDANVLYPAPLRDLLMQLAVGALFRARWSADIHREWIDALIRNEPFRRRQDLERTRDLMDRAIRDCLVIGYDSLIPTLDLPDLGDRHVLAAAIAGGCDVIVTHNVKDFPESVLGQYGIETHNPDDFLLYLLDLAPDRFCDAVSRVRARLRNPPYSVEDYLETLQGIGLVATVDGLTPFAARLQHPGEIRDFDRR